MYPDSAPLLGLIGRKGSGKDFTANALIRQIGFTRLAFADRVREFVLDADPFVGHGSLRVSDLVASVGWDRAKVHPEIRRALQTCGMAARALDANVWLRPVMEAAADFRTLGMPVVITDVRMHAEVQAIRDAGGIFVEVRRDGLTTDTADAHITEALAQTGALSELCSYTVYNDPSGAGVQRFLNRLLTDLDL